MATASRLYLTRASLTVTNEWGQRYAVPATFRVDGRDHAREGWRVDRVSLCGPESIDGGQGFRTRREATAHLATWIEASRAQGTYYPRGTRGWLGAK